jgi:hypothetical protein
VPFTVFVVLTPVVDAVSAALFAATAVVETVVVSGVTAMAAEADTIVRAVAVTRARRFINS